MTINDNRNDSKGVTAIDVQVHFAGDIAGISHQKLFGGWMIRIRQEEVPVLVSPMQQSIIVNNQPAMNVRTGIIQTPQTLKTPLMQEFIAFTTSYSMGENRTP